MITASIIGPTFLTVMMDGVTHTVNSDHVNYREIREALKAKDHTMVEKLINLAASVINYASGRIRIHNGSVFYGQHEVKGSVVQRILNMMREGFDAEPMIRFLENLMSNPSKRAVDELYGFLESTALPITEDGHFLAYKKVNKNYLDFHTGKMDNSVGKVVEMPRNQVDDNRDVTCSYGLHFCSLGYLPHYHGGNGRVMIVKINPADVVSIPVDYNNAKGRTCRYEVIGEHPYEDQEAFTSSIYRDFEPVDPTDYEDEHDDDDEQWDLGYNAGYEMAKIHSSDLLAYNETAPDHDHCGWMEGYSFGYSEGYDVDWQQAAHDRGFQDASDGLAYNDQPVDACDQDEVWRLGYADGYHVGKVNLIG